MIHFDLTREDADFLRQQLEARAHAYEVELVHTDQRALRADVARDLERLEKLLANVQAACS